MRAEGESTVKQRRRVTKKPRALLCAHVREVLPRHSESEQRTKICKKRLERS